MKKLALAAVALSVAACSTTDGGNGHASVTSTPAGTRYCWQDRLSAAGGKLTCNWSGDRRDACEATQFTTVDAARFSVPHKSSLCANGQWLVEVKPAG